MASIWEIAIKKSLDNLNLASDFNNILPFLEENSIELLPISFIHIQKLLLLEHHHRDPFDRIIIAQSLDENLTVVTKDENFPKYAPEILWK